MPSRLPASLLRLCVELLQLLKVSPYGLPECKVRSAMLSTLDRAEDWPPKNLPGAQRNARRTEAVEDALSWCKVERYVELFNNPVLDDANRRALTTRTAGPCRHGSKPAGISRASSVPATRRRLRSTRQDRPLRSGLRGLFANYGFGESSPR